jgi:hypothetical protein
MTEVRQTSPARPSDGSSMKINVRMLALVTSDKECGILM